MLAKAKLAGEVAARGYRVKLQRQGYTAQRTTDNNNNTVWRQIFEG